jgi:hypothetical protein
VIVVLLLGAFLAPLLLAVEVIAGVRIASVGDFGEASVDTRNVADLIKSWNPDLIFTSGDNTYDDTPIDDNVGQFYADYIGNYIGEYGPGSSVNRFFPSLGNHDYSDGDGLEAYLEYFTLPGDSVASSRTSANERYYDFIVGPVHFFALNSNNQEPDGRDANSTQAEWLRTQLAASTSPWKIVFFHHTPYSSGESHGSSLFMQWPFKEWGADAVVAGHDHVYERLVIDDFPYFVNGLGGRNIKSFADPIPGSVVRYNDDFGAMRIDADHMSLTFEFHSVTGGDSLVDSFTLVQSPPDVATVPSALDFGDTPLGTSVEATLRVRNQGGAPLVVSSTSIGGSHPEEFAITSVHPPAARRGGEVWVATAGSFMLPPGMTANVQIRFTPSAEGAKSALLQVASNDPDEDLVEIAISAYAVPPPQPDIAVSSSLYDFGGVFVPNNTATQRIAVRNDGGWVLQISDVSLTGPESAEFGIVSGGGASTLAPGDTLDVIASFTPASAGPKSALLQIQSDDPDEGVLELTLTGIGITMPEGTVLFQESVRGGSVGSSSVTTSSDVSAVEGHLYLAAIASKRYEPVARVSGLGLDWTLVRAQCGAREQTGVEVWRGAGTPVAGAVSAELERSPNTAVIIVTRYASVDSTAPLAAVASANTNGVDGDCDGGSDTDSYAFDLTTSVPDALVHLAVAMRSRVHTPANGFITRDESVAGNGGSASSVATLDREFEDPGTARIEGSFEGNVDWAVVAVEIRAQISYPKIDVSPISYDYGSIHVGESGTASFEIRNQGSVDLHVHSLKILGPDAPDFEITNGAPVPALPPGGQHTVQVEFLAQSLGVKSAFLRIVSNDGTATTLDIPLQAASIQPPPQPDIALSPMSLDFGEIPAWTTSSQSTLLWNEGDAPLQVTSIALVGPDSLEFAIPGGSAGFSLAPGDSTAIEVLFVPVTAGSKSAALRITSDDPDEDPLDVALAGVGVAPIEGMVTFEESVRGDSEGSSTVTTSSSISAVEGNLYLATVASKSFAPVTSVTGLGFDWTAVHTQCSGRYQTGVQVWVASGFPSAGPVTATLENSVDSAAIIVSRYSGVDLDTPFGSIGSVNTNGVDGGCSGGEDDTAYQLDVTTTEDDALLFVAVAMRNRQHTPSPGFVLRDESQAGTNGAISSVAVLDQEFETPGEVSVEGTFSGDVDYAVVAIELRPFVGIAKHSPLETDIVSRPGLLLRNSIGGGAAWVELASPQPQPARVRIYDVRGRFLTTLWNGPMPAGRTRIEWTNGDRRAIAAGIYFVRAEIGTQRFTGKMLLLR